MTTESVRHIIATEHPKPVSRYLERVRLDLVDGVTIEAGLERYRRR